MIGQNPIQEAIKDRLVANSYFAGVPVIVSDDGDIADAIDKKTKVLHGGLAMVVLIPFGINPNPQVKAIRPELMVEVTATENVIINRGATGLNKTAYEAIRKAIALLHHWTPGVPFTRLEFQEFGEFGAKNDTNQSILLYRALFKTTEVIQ